MKRTATVGVLLSLTFFIGALSRGWADGISETPLYYAGVLEEDGVPVEGSRTLELELWDDGSDADQSHRVCATRPQDVVIEDGRFRVPLDPGCTDQIHQNADLWIEILAGGVSLGRTKLGAVPYAVESARASEASGALRDRLDTMVPPGTVVAYAGPRPPIGWLLCDGAEISRAEYPALFEAIGNAHGGGDGATTFRLPDYRGRFLRGADAGAGRDAEAAAREAASPGGNVGEAIGSVQGYATAMPRTPLMIANAGGHTHSLIRGLAYPGATLAVDYGMAGQVSVEETAATGDHTHLLTGGDPETRPQNAAVSFIIRY